MRLVQGCAVAVALGALACSNTGTLQSAPDGAVGGRDGGGALDATGYAAWWYPECQTAAGSCPLDTCLPNAIVVVADRCGPFQSLEVGCVSRMTVVSSWFCVMRESTGELIFTLYPPKGDGFIACQGYGVPAGGLPAEGSLCPDGAVD